MPAGVFRPETSLTPVRRHGLHEEGGQDPPRGGCMAWREVTVVSARLEFVRLAAQPGANIKELCHRYGVSRPTGYKWLERYEREGEAGLGDRSRRPALSPRRSSAELEQRVVGLRDDYP